MGLVLVLVEPAGPLNIGSVARLCANFGVDSLRLVAPRCDPFGDESRRMAVHGLALLEGAQLHPSLEAAIADCRRVVACSGRAEGPPLPLEPPGPALRWLLEGIPCGADGRQAAQRAEDPAPEAAPPIPLEPGQAPDGPQPRASSGGAGALAALVFGREDRGLSNDELLQAGRLLCIATGAAYSSLNLSHAVAVVLHELHALRTAAASGCAEGPGGLAPPSTFRDPEPDPCARAELEAALADGRDLLLEVGFLLPHTAQARMAKLRALLQRAAIRSPEVALLRGMVAQLRWACRRGGHGPG